MQDLPPSDEPSEALCNASENSKDTMMPIEVRITTSEHEIQGLIYVSRDARPERRLTELLNDSHKRFLSIIDVELIHRHNPSTPRRYSFLQVQMDNILMIHPATEQAMQRVAYTENDVQRFDQFRTKVNRNGD